MHNPGVEGKIGKYDTFTKKETFSRKNNYTKERGFEQEDTSEFVRMSVV